MSTINHQNNFGTNLTSNQIAGVTTTPLNSIPSIAAPFYIALDATNINGSYEVVLVTSKTATNINHAATSYAHTTAEEVRMVVPAAEMDALWDGVAGWTPTTETLTYSSADAPTYVCTTSSDLTGSISVGMKIKLTHSATTKYFIVTAITSGTITLYGGTDYTLAGTAITSVSYSSMKAPFGFPIDPLKWSTEAVDTSNRSQASPVQNTWYNLGTVLLNVPIGAWKLSYSVGLQGNVAAAVAAGPFHVTLSTANNSESDVDFTSANYVASASGATNILSQVSKEKFVTVASKTPYYLNTRTTSASQQNINNRGDLGKTIVRAVCAYL